MLTTIADNIALNAVAKANQALVHWAKHSLNHEDADRAHRYMMAHYSLFVQLREALIKKGSITTQDGEVATKTAGGPFLLQD